MKAMHCFSQEHHTQEEDISTYLEHFDSPSSPVGAAWVEEDHPDATQEVGHHRDEGAAADAWAVEGHPRGAAAAAVGEAEEDHPDEDEVDPAGDVDDAVGAAAVVGVVATGTAATGVAGAVG
jgi:hypothetical protein